MTQEGIMIIVRRIQSYYITQKFGKAFTEEMEKYNSNNWGEAYYANSPDKFENKPTCDANGMQSMVIPEAIVTDCMRHDCIIHSLKDDDEQGMADGGYRNNGETIAIFARKGGQLPPYYRDKLSTYF